MVITNEYKIIRERTFFRINCEKKHLCPSCKSVKLSPYGWRYRMVIVLSGKKYRFIIQRLRCSFCGKIHHLIPNFILPNKNYSAVVVAEIIKGVNKSVPCDDSTIARLRNWFYKGISMLKVQDFYINNLTILEKINKNRNEKLAFYTIIKLISST